MCIVQKLELNNLCKLPKALGILHQLAQKRGKTARSEGAWIFVKTLRERAKVDVLPQSDDNFG
jgi:hypothetical protein